jgi:hypothetical protein
LLALLLVAYGLRVWLACGGGQMFWPDEGRYVLSEIAAADIWQGHWHAAASQLLGQGQHTLFPDFGLVPALAERFTGLHRPLIASYFSIFSVLAILLIWAIARRAGAGEAEALWAAFLAACANSLFYYSRHFFPYDISLCAMLWALWLGMGAWSWRNSVLVGAVAGLGFLTYNGYWWLGGCVLILHALLGPGGLKRLPVRAVGAGGALAAVILLVFVLSRALGHNLVGEDAQGAAVVFGDFSSGPRLIVEYLWQAEGGLILLLGAASGYGFYSAWRDRRADRLAWYGGGIVLVVAGLVVLSDPVLIPVFGRRVREVMPFLCLSAALGIVRFVGDRGRRWRVWTAAIALLAGALAAWNFSGPLRQVFPDGFRQLAAAAASHQSGYQAYREVFVRSLQDGPLDDTLPPFPTILRRSHPLQFRPYQDEGFDPGRLAEINRRDVAMRLLGLPGHFESVAGRWQGYPGPVRLRVRFPATSIGLAQSLLATGRTGRGDIFYVRYVDAGHVRFGLDHWGVSATNSAPIAVDYAQPHVLDLFAGFLLPPAENPPQGPDHAFFLQRGRLVLLLDGRPVFSMAEAFYPVPPATITFGMSFIGGSAAGDAFTGDILEFGPAPDSAQAVLRSILAPPGESTK